MKHSVKIILLSSVILFVPACKLFFWKEKSETPPSQMIFTFFGVPGSGKGTLAEQCVKELGFLSLSTGNLLREAVARGDDLGKKAQTYMKEGKLVPDEIVAELVEKWLLAHVPSYNPIILDGYPRTTKQAELFMHLLKKKFAQVHLYVVELKISDEAIIKRLVDRLVCQKCQRIYSRTMVKDTTQCQVCDGRLIRREDDKEAVVRERLNVYAQTSAPLIEFYKAVGIPIKQLSVEGKSVNEVFEDFKKIYDSLRGIQNQKAHAAAETAHS